MERKAIKYRVIDKSSTEFGRKIRAIPNELLEYVDIKTGKTYDIKQLQKVPDRHALYFGLRIGRFGILIFGRDYWHYRSLQFGLSIEWIKGAYGHLDIEAHALCFGVGVRFERMAKIN